MQQRADDIELLRKLLDDYGEQISDGQREKFADMLMNVMQDERHILTDKQRQWARQVLEVHQPEYLNLFSSGKVPRGHEVPTPPALQNLPKRPPGMPVRETPKPYVPRYLDTDGNIHEGFGIPVEKQEGPR